nr:hypothetical protein [uncultured Noviherbaspirillum sp.]
MNSSQENRDYVAQALKGLGVDLPEKYLAMLSETPVHQAISGLSPWFFPANPDRAVKFCSEAAGRPVFPFAQAVEEDKMACFVVEPGGKPAVIVINPWSENKTTVVQALLPSYDAWRKYAAEVSRDVRAREAENDE